MLWNAAKARPKADVKPEQNVRHEAAAMVPAGQGDVIIVWRAVVPQGSDIYAQKLDTDGKRIWRNGGVEICHQSIADAHFSAVTDSQGGVIVIWEDSREGEYNTDIYAQRLDEYGKPMWNRTGVPVCTARHQQLFPKAVVDQRGGVYVFWTDYRNGNADIFACHLDFEGRVDHRFSICTEKEDQMDLTVAPSPFGGACVVWVDHRFDSPGIYAQLINANDSLRWRAGGLPVCTGVYQQETPSVISVNKKGFAVAWADYRDRLAKVFVQLVNSDGVMVFLSGGISASSSSGPQYIPCISAVDSTAAVVTWLQYEKGAGMLQRRIDLTKSVQTNLPYAISRPSLAQFWASSVPDGKGGSVATWLEYDGGKIKVFAQRTAADGKCLWGKAGRLIGAAKEKSHPQIVIDGMHRGFIIAWTGESAVGSDIVVACVSEEGKIMWKREV